MQVYVAVFWTMFVDESDLYIAELRVINVFCLCLHLIQAIIVPA